MRFVGILVSDFKLVFRDASLRLFLFIPLLILLVINPLLPALIERFPIISAYVPYVLMGALVQASIMFGFIYAMVFIEEKETAVASVYGVLPVSKKGFVLMRLLLGVVISISMAWLVLVVQPFYKFSVIQGLGISFLAGLIAPMLALLVALLSKNKMEGMTWFKGINIFVSLPLLAYFVPDSYAWLFGILPAYWPYEVLMQVILVSDFSHEFLIGFGYAAFLLMILIHLFTRKQYI